MHVAETTTRPTHEQVRSLVQFVDDTAAADGARGLSDHLWLDLRSGGAPGFVVATVTDDHGIAAIAQVSAANDGSALEALVRPDRRDHRKLLDDVLATALERARAEFAARVTWWVDDADDADRAFAAANGLVPDRALFEMRRSLPHELRAEVETRSFVPGADDEAWVRVNNRAFADHGEQGGWTTDTLRLRQAEDWFDADGFRLHEIDGRLAAFCWTKLHHETDPVIGEIYVIAVDPEFHGRGLGKQLTLAGLDSIADRGIVVANLYVDAANDAAVGLYRGLGFDIHRRRDAFVTTS